MDEPPSFGVLVRRRRKALDLTQRALAHRVGCAEVTIQKIEAAERRPSAQIAERLADQFGLDDHERAAFLSAARGRSAREPLPAVPPVDAGRAARHNLPGERTSFVGRERDLARLHQLAAEHRLLTLIGPGGTGKTRLALRLAAALTAAFPDGVWVVNLAALREPALVVQAVATTLGIRDEGSQALDDTLLARLRERRLLLVLDNCEHLVAACARLAAAVLHSAPDLRLLTTSREPLSIAGEATFVVPPLALPDPDPTLAIDDVARSEAVQLFVARASAVRSGFALLPSNVAAVAHLCRRLDGIPLALELAAARVRVLTVAQIAARLDDRFQLLTGGSRTDLPHQQTLLASLDWSYELLSEGEQALLRRLATFADSWTLDAAEAVCGDADTPRAGVLDLVTRLVDCSLVVVTEQDGVARYRQLETIRQYALDKLRTSGELGVVQQRHATYYLACAQAADNENTWKQQLEHELDNVRAALRWSLATGDVEVGAQLADALGWFWYRQGYWREGRSWLQQVRGLLDSQPHEPVRARLLFYEGLIAQFQGDVATGRVLMEQSLTLSREHGDSGTELSALHNLGVLAREEDDVVRATQLFEAALALAVAEHRQAGRGWPQISLGEVAVMREDVAQATTWLTIGLATFQAVDVPVGIAWALNHLAHVAQLEGQYVRAAELHAQSLPLFGTTDRQGVAWAHVGVGEAALAQDDLAEAARSFTESLRIFGELGDSAITWSLAGLAGVAVRRGAPEVGARLWGAVEALREASHRRPAPAARAGHERSLALGRASLGDAAFGAAWSLGRRLTLEQAISYALEDQSGNLTPEATTGEAQSDAAPRLP